MSSEVPSAISGHGAHVKPACEANGAVSANASAPTPAQIEAEGITALDTTTQAPPKNDTPRKPRGPTKAQQLATTYQYPLPLRTFPLPTFIPSNPLSLLHLLYTWVSQAIAPPTSHPAVLYQGVFSPSLRSVHVTDPVAIRALWEQGFYGKGSLSRSELSWLDREKRRVGEGASKTSEEVTRQRRAERQQVKWERARLQQEAIEAKRREEEDAARAVVDAVVGHTKPLIAHGDIAPTDPAQLLSMPNSPADIEAVASLSSPPAPTDAHAPSPSEVPDPVTTSLDTGMAAPSASPLPKSVRFSAPGEEHTLPGPDAPAPHPIPNKEHLQLTPPEAFYLHYALGVLQITSPATNAPIPTRELFAHFRATSTFPLSTTSPPSSTSTSTSSARPQPDDDFLLNYIVYAHFRSLGWVIRSGVKFGIDYLLYARGPVFTHAEFGVLILPAYTAAFWSCSAPSEMYPAGPKAHVQKQLGERGRWAWLHAINRVNAQVKKTVLLVFVDVPAPVPEGGAEGMGVEELLGRYAVREVVVRRWVSNRSRD